MWRLVLAMMVIGCGNAASAAPCVKVYDDLRAFVAAPPCDEGTVMPTPLAEELTVYWDTAREQCDTEIEKVRKELEAARDRERDRADASDAARIKVEAQWRACEDGIEAAATPPESNGAAWFLGGVGAGVVAALVVVLLVP